MAWGKERLRKIIALQKQMENYRFCSTENETLRSSKDFRAACDDFSLKRKVNSQERLK